jgi:hypothetical protein
VNDTRAKTLIIDRILSPIIREMFELYATGSMTIEGLAVYLADRGVMSRANKRDPGGKILHVDQISNMLRNPLYYGSFRYADKIYDGKHEPLISKSLFDRVQEILAMRSHCIPLQRVAKPYLRLIRCADCCMAITAEVQKGNVYYRCTRKSRTESCHAPFIREEQLEAQLTEAVSQYGLTTEQGEDFIRRIDAEASSITDTNRRLLAEARATLKEIANELNRLLELYLSQTIDRSEYVLQQNKLHSKKSSLMESITQLEGASTHWLELFKKWVNTAQQLGSLVKKASPTERRRLAAEVFGSNLRLSGKKLSGEAVKPWFSQPKTGSQGSMVDIYSSARQHFLELQTSF